MNIDDLTLKQIKEIHSLNLGNNSTQQNAGIQYGIGKSVIIRTYSAGVWFGTLSQKAGNEGLVGFNQRTREGCDFKWFMSSHSTS